MSQFAFQVSWPDLVRKIGYRYEHPVDYLSSLIGRFYDPGARLDITVEPLRIEVRSDSLIHASLFDQALSGSPLDSTFVIPPVAEYSAVRILSGRRGIAVDSQRAIHRADLDAFHHGTIITIQRDREPREDRGGQDGDAGIIARLERLYWGSDIRVTLNGRALYSQTYSFNTGAFEGAISYDAAHEGGIRYYALGRFIEGEPSIDGINVLVHRHPFRTTLTSSHVIKTGEEHLQMQHELPHIMAGYLESPYGLELAKRNPHSWRVLYQTILARFPEDQRLRLLADRLAPSGAGGSTVRSTASRPGGSTGHASLSLKVLILCSVMALCLGMWRHSQADRPLAVAQSAAGSARAPASIVSTSASNPTPGRSAPGSEMAPGSSGSIPLPDSDAGRAVPGSAPAPEESASTSNPNLGRPAPGPVGASGDSVRPQISVRTGQDYGTPSGNHAKESAPGVNYSTSSALAEDLKHMEEEAEKNGTSHQGYVPGSTFNVLTMSDGHLEWSNLPPYDTLVDRVQHPVWPPEFATVSGHAEGIRAVRSYLNRFAYGGVPLDVGRRYTDDLSALLGERKADCTSSNTLAAHLLFELGYRKVTAIIGTRGGCPHMWLNVWEDGRWRIEDFTPARMSPDFAQACLAHSVSLPVGPESQGSSDAPADQWTEIPNPSKNAALFQGSPGSPASQAQADTDDPDSLTGDPGIQDSLDRLIDHRTSVIFFDLCIILALFCLAYSVVSFVLRQRARQAAAAENWSAAAESVRDLLGLAAVNTGKEAAYDRRTHTLTLDIKRLSGDGPFVSAVKAVPLVSRDEAQQQALYRRLADRAVR